MIVYLEAVQTFVWRWEKRNFAYLTLVHFAYLIFLSEVLKILSGDWECANHSTNNGQFCMVVLFIL